MKDITVMAVAGGLRAAASLFGSALYVSEGAVHSDVRLSGAVTESWVSRTRDKVTVYMETQDEGDVERATITMPAGVARALRQALMDADLGDDFHTTVWQASDNPGVVAGGVPTWRRVVCQNTVFSDLTLRDTNTNTDEED